MVALNPRLSRRQPMEEAATPFPSEETTPPVTKIYFGAIRAVRGFKRGLIGPPQVTYKELWMQREKLSIDKRGSRILCRGNLRFIWSRARNFWLAEAEVPSDRFESADNDAEFAGLAKVERAKS